MSVAAYWEARATAVDPGGPVESFRQIVAALDEKALNAARRNKPTMWAYYGEMADWLRDYFADVSLTDAGYAGAALALAQRAKDECPTLARGEAAALWARGVYARRILNAWTPAPHDRPSLQWLRDRVQPAPVGLDAIDTPPVAEPVTVRVQRRRERGKG